VTPTPAPLYRRTLRVIWVLGVLVIAAGLGFSALPWDARVTVCAAGKVGRSIAFETITNALQWRSNEPVDGHMTLPPRMPPPVRLCKRNPNFGEAEKLAARRLF
jgi:hypothetical protein